MKNWKIGAIAGLIAGIVGGISSIFVAIYLIENGIAYWDVETLSIISLKQIIAVEIALNMIWGIILGVIYSKIYDVIPGKGIAKGLTVGLIYVLIFNVRFAMICIMYSIPHFYLHLIVIYILIGLSLGISYEFLSNRYISRKEKVVTIKYDFTGGIYPGAIAGIVVGISAFFLTVVIMNPLLWPKLIADIGFLISQLGSHALFNLIWGIVFGILFAMFYDKIPKKGILKGLIFGIVLFFFLNFQSVIRNLIYPYNNMMALWTFLAALFVFIPFGIVIGYLYKPSK